MERKKLNILIIEDNESDALLCIYHLEKAGFTIIYQLVETADEIRNALSTSEFDLVLSDSSLPNLNAKNIFEIFKSYNTNIPFILISGAFDNADAEEVLKIGVHDYLLKNNLNQISLVVAKALRK